MKKSVIFCVLFVIALGAQFVSANTEGAEITMSQPSDTINVEEYDNMYFNSICVVDRICYGTPQSGAWYVIYDDVDAGLYYQAIRVTKATYDMVVDALKSGKEMRGRLISVQEYETVEYQFQAEE